MVSLPNVWPQAESRPRSLGAQDAVVIDGETVVYASGEVHLLNSTAALIWQGCDGAKSLEALALELAELFQASPDMVLRQVIELAGSLADRGLVAFDQAGAFAPSSDPIPFGKPMLRTASACSGCGNGPAYDFQIIVDVGDVAVAVGADSLIVDQIESGFGGRVLGRIAAPASRPAYGVVVPDLVEARLGQPVARLQRGPDVLFRSRDPERVLRALLAQVSTHSVPVGQLALEAIAIGADGRAVLVPVPENRVAYARRAARLGLSVSDAPVTLAGTDPPIIQVGCAWTDIDGAEVRLRGFEVVRGTEPGALPWGAHEMVAICVSGGGGAASVFGELAMTRGDEIERGGSGEATLNGLLRLARSVPVVVDPGPDSVAAILHETA